MQRSSVVLPEPLGPMIASFWVLGTAKSMPHRTSVSPNRLCRSTILSNGSMNNRGARVLPWAGDPAAPARPRAGAAADQLVLRQCAPSGDFQLASRSTPTRGFGSGGVNHEASLSPYFDMILTFSQFAQTLRISAFMASASCFSSLLTPKMTLYFVDMIGYFAMSGLSSTWWMFHSGCWTAA